MSDILQAWARQLVFLALFATVMEMLLPAGELRRYAKMVLGLVVILAVLDPLLQILQGHNWADTWTYGLVGQDNVSSESAVQAGMQMMDAALAGAAQAVRADVTGQMEALLMSIGGVEEASVDLATEEPRILIRTAVGADDNTLVERVRSVVATFLGAKPASIRVEVEQGGR